MNNNNNKQIWVVSVSVQVLPDSPLAVEDAVFCSGRVLVPCEKGDDPVLQIQTVLQEVRRVLVENKLILKDISNCFRYVEEQWLGENRESQEMRRFAARALVREHGVLGVFESQASILS